jgi:hypothetical protein
MRSIVTSLLFDILQVPAVPSVRFVSITIYTIALAFFLYWLFISPLRNVKYFHGKDDQQAFAILTCIILAILISFLDLNPLGWVCVSLVSLRFLQGRWIGPLEKLPFITKLNTYAKDVEMGLCSVSTDIETFTPDAITYREEIQNIKAALSIGKKSILVSGSFFAAALFSALFLTSSCFQIFLCVVGRREPTDIPYVVFGNMGIAFFLQMFSKNVVLLLVDEVAMHKLSSFSPNKNGMKENTSRLEQESTAQKQSVLGVIVSLIALAVVGVLGMFTYFIWFIGIRSS